VLSIAEREHRGLLRRRSSSAGACRRHLAGAGLSGRRAVVIVKKASDQSLQPGGLFRRTEGAVLIEFTEGTGVIE
jgi:hypothetical protein